MNMYVFGRIARTTCIDAAYCNRSYIVWSVCVVHVSVTPVNCCAKTAEKIAMPFGVELCKQHKLVNQSQSSDVPRLGR